MKKYSGMEPCNPLSVDVLLLLLLLLLTELLLLGLKLKTILFRDMLSLWIKLNL